MQLCDFRHGTECIHIDIKGILNWFIWLILINYVYYYLVFDDLHNINKLLLFGKTVWINVNYFLILCVIYSMYLILINVLLDPYEFM